LTLSGPAALDRCAQSGSAAGPTNSIVASAVINRREASCRVGAGAFGYPLAGRHCLATTLEQEYRRWSSLGGVALFSRTSHCLRRIAHPRVSARTFLRQPKLAMALRVVLRTVSRNGDLRRVQLGYAGFVAVEQAYWIALLVRAYNQGGTTRAGIVAVVQLAPAAIFAPFGAVLPDRHSPLRVQTLAYAAQASALGATAISLLLGWPDPVSYTLAALASVALTLTRPTQAVLLPSLARVPEELTAANVVSSWVASSAAFLAPALTGVLLAIGSPGVVFAVCATVMASAALLLARTARPVVTPTAPKDERWRSEGLTGVRRGFQTLREQEEARHVVRLLGGQFVVVGALDVLVITLSIRVLGMGNAGVGYLAASFGAGAMMGAAFTVVLVGRRRLVPFILGAAVLWGASFLLLAGTATRLSALLLLAVAGAGRSLLDVAGRTLLQRISPPAVLARVFGILEALAMAALAVGALLTPILVSLLGPKVAFVGLGAILPASAAVRVRRLLAADSAATVPVVETALLRELPIFASLPPPTLEGLAHSLQPVSASRGTVVIRQGEIGDRYYAIADGEVDVFCDARYLTTLGRGEGFGEIALLRSVPRTATVSARSDVHLYALDKDSFLMSVTGHASAAQAAETIISKRTAAGGALRP
jgi:MFS family permease